jgi:hypothetical protein
MRVGTHVHAGACVRHRMWSTCCAPARAAHGPSVHIKHTYGRPPSSTRRRQPARGTCRLASSSACHAYSSPSPSSQHSSLVPALGVEVHQAVLVRASAGSSNPCGRASCGRPSSRSRRPRASSPTRQMTRRQPPRPSPRLRARRRLRPRCQRRDTGREPAAPAAPATLSRGRRGRRLFRLLPAPAALALPAPAFLPLPVEAFVRRPCAATSRQASGKAICSAAPANE